VAKQKKQRQQEEEEKTHRDRDRDRDRERRCLKESEEKHLREEERERFLREGVLSILLPGEREKEKHLKRGGVRVICFVLGGKRRRAGKVGEEGDANRENSGSFFFPNLRVFLVVSSQCPTQCPTHGTKNLFLRKLYVEEQAIRIPKIRSHTIRRSRSRSQATMMGALAETGSDRLPPDHHLNPGRFLAVLES